MGYRHNTGYQLHLRVFKACPKVELLRVIQALDFTDVTEVKVKMYERPDDALQPPDQAHIEVHFVSRWQYNWEGKTLDSAKAFITNLQPPANPTDDRWADNSAALFTDEGSIEDLDAHQFGIVRYRKVMEKRLSTTD